MTESPVPEKTTQEQAISTPANTLPMTARQSDQRLKILEEGQLKIATVLTQLDERLKVLENLKTKIEDATAKMWDCKDSPLLKMFGGGIDLF